MSKIESRIKRKLSIRKKINGDGNKPRVTVYRSNRYFYAQAIDDVKAVTKAGIRSKANAKKEDITKLAEDFAKILQKQKVNETVFDRNGYKYHGLVAAFAQGLRKAKLLK